MRVSSGAPTPKLQRLAAQPDDEAGVNSLY